MNSLSNIIPMVRRGVPTAPTAPKVTVPQPASIVEANVCQICHGHGWLRTNKPLNDPLFGKIVKCKCEENKTEAARRAASRQRTYRWIDQNDDLATAMEAMTFTSFKPKYRVDGESVNFSDAFRRTRDVADLLKWQAKNQSNVLLLGDFGVGKTHLACSILNECRADGMDCLFATAPGLFKAIYAASFEDQEALIQNASQTKVFVLDDLDKLYVKRESNPNVEPGSYQKSVLFDIFNARSIAKLPTIITTNEEKDLGKWLDRAVISRLFGDVVSIEMRGQDYRQIGGSR